MPTRTSITRLDKSRFDRTQEGYLITKVNPTRVGVFAYFDDETGKVVKEFRPPEEVGDPESLASLNRKIVTDDHPPIMLDADNTEKYNNGHMTADHVMAADGVHTESELVVTSKKLIKKVDAGKEQVSCGYTCDIDDTPGTYNGEDYDRIQRNIQYNHLAIVDRGRAKTAALTASRGARGDSQLRSVARYDAYEIEPEDDVTPLPRPAVKKVPVVKQDKTEKVWRKYKMPDYRHDGEIYDVSPEALTMLKFRDKEDEKARADAADAIKKANDAAAKARQDAADAKAEFDKQAVQLQAKLDEAEEKIEALKDIDARVDAREALKAKAIAVIGKDYKTQGKTDEDIKLDIFKKAFPNAVSKLDSMSDSQKPLYIEARLDGLDDAKAAPNGSKVLAAVNHVDAAGGDEDDAYFDDELN